MNRCFVIGDIHGAFRALEQLIGLIEPQPSDRFLFLGDFVDSWSEPVEVISFLLNFAEQYDCVFIRGNHDELLRDYFEFGKAHKKWLKHGGQSTIDAYNRQPQFREKHLLFLQNLKNYYQDDQGHLFIHGGFTNLKGVEQEWFEKMFYWDRTLWELACAIPKDLEPEALNYPKRLKLYPKVFIGHTPTLRMGSDSPLVKHNVYNIDTGGGFNKGRLTAYEINSDTYLQSSPVGELYPEEEGRTV